MPPLTLGNNAASNLSKKQVYFRLVLKRAANGRVNKASITRTTEISNSGIGGVGFGVPVGDVVWVGG